MLLLLLLSSCATSTLLLNGNFAVPVEYPEVRMIIFRDSHYSKAITDGTMEDFYTTLLNSTYIDWLSEYNINNREIHRGTFTGLYEIDVKHDIDSLKSMYGNIENEIIRNINIGNIPEETYNTIYVCHLPNNISCSLIGGGHFGRYAYIFECSGLTLPLNKPMFWSGIVFTCFTLILLCIWPVIACNASSGKFGKCNCGFDLSGKTLYHCLMIGVCILLLFIGGLMTGIAYINNRELYFQTGFILLYVCAGVFIFWILSTAIILAVPKFTSAKWCFNYKEIACSLRVFNIMYGTIAAIGVVLSITLVVLSLGSNLQITASHELMEVIAGDWRGPPPLRKGMCNYCQFETDVLYSPNGYMHHVQKCWSNLHQSCFSNL